MSSVMLYALIAVLALMAIISGRLVLILFSNRKRSAGKRSAPPSPPPSLAEAFADQILAGRGSEGLLKEHFSAPRGKCRNCGGKKPRWTPAAADRYLQQPHILAEAIQNAELCAPCLWVLAKTAGGWKVVPAVPADKAEPKQDPGPIAPPPSPPSEKGGERKVWTRIAAGALVVPMAGLGLQMGLTGLAAAFLLEGAGAFGTFIAAAAFTVAGVFTIFAVVLAKIMIRK